MRIGDKPGDQDDVPLAVIAYTDGEITNMNDGTGGLSIYQKGNDGRYYWYAHLSKTTTTGGISVKAGDIIGCMGTSGNAGGYLQHLHFHIGTKPDITTIPENYPTFIWPYQDFCRTVGVCGALNPEQYPELPYL
jgi:murein DD-endopeptidase MepM/ murein hydrolase activator NlpD